MHVRSPHRSSRPRQSGAIIVTTALLLLFLLGFIGIALDFGRLFIVRGELQTALDSCALSAAAELDGTSTAQTRGIASGIAAGNANGVNLQSGNWAGQSQITAADISFFGDDAKTPPAKPENARYAQCAHQHGNVKLFLLSALNAFFGSTVAPSAGAVATTAVATRASAQTSCPIPVMLRAKSGGVKPDYGYAIGEWVPTIDKSSTGGQFGWANFDGSSSAKGTKEDFSEHCGSSPGSQTYSPQPLGTPGLQASVFRYWNARFGIYKEQDSKLADLLNPTSPGDLPEAFAMRPDYTGYGYTPYNWKTTTPPSNAYGDFLAKRAAFAPCGSSVDNCGITTDGDKNTYQTYKTDLPSTGSPASHQLYGSSRRIVLVPVVGSSSTVVDFACMLMLHPIPQPLKGEVYLEYRGNANRPDSPCTTSGMAGGSVGPLVPVLVR